MPANLIPQHLETDYRFKRANSAFEKIKTLKDTIAIILPTDFADDPVFRRKY